MIFWEDLPRGANLCGGDGLPCRPGVWLILSKHNSTSGSNGPHGLYSTYCTSTHTLLHGAMTIIPFISP